MGRARNVVDSVAIVIKVNIDMVPTNLIKQSGLSRLYGRDATLPHVSFRAGKNRPYVRNFRHAGRTNVGKIHPPRLHMQQRNVELLNLPFRPSWSERKSESIPWQRLADK